MLSHTFLIQLTFKRMPLVQHSGELWKRNVFDGHWGFSNILEYPQISLMILHDPWWSMRILNDPQWTSEILHDPPWSSIILDDSPMAPQWLINVSLMTHKLFLTNCRLLPKWLNGDSLKPMMTPQQIINNHSRDKFKDILVTKPGRKSCYYKSS